jgi:hypothetical protein
MYYDDESSSPSACACWVNEHLVYREWNIATYIVCLFLVFIALFVGGSLGLIRGALLISERLPPLSEDLADLCKRDAGVFLAHIIALLVGEKHVCRKASLGGIGICYAGLISVPKTNRP